MGIASGADSSAPSTTGNASSGTPCHRSLGASSIASAARGSYPASRTARADSRTSSKV